MLLDELKKKKILILGFGREGRDTLVFLRKLFPKKKIGITDQKTSLPFNFNGREKHTVLYLGKNYLTALKKYDVIIKSPGIPSRVIQPFLSNRQRVTSQTEIFFENCPGTIVGVTGTKGKSTTASLIYAVLKKGGVKAHLIGNIEKPVLGYLGKVPLRGISRRETTPEDVFVYELSSFQLTNLKKSPHIAVLLNIYPEHLDYYGGSFREYTKAKANITRHQTPEDLLIYNSKDVEVCKIAKASKAQKLPFTPKGSQTSLRIVKSDFHVYLASPEPAIIVGRLFGIPEKKIQQAIRNFKPLPHRLERIGEWKDITFYNDSLATIPEATIAALDALGPKVHTLIAGGHDRGISFEKLGKKIVQNKIKLLILFPDTGEKILQSVRQARRVTRPGPITRPGLVIRFAKSMKEAVKLCYLHTPKGKICLLSPASSSFNMFKDYKDRGQQFTKWVKILSHGKKA